MRVGARWLAVGNDWVISGIRKRTGKKPFLHHSLLEEVQRYEYEIQIMIEHYLRCYYYKLDTYKVIIIYLIKIKLKVFILFLLLFSLLYLSFIIRYQYDSLYKQEERY